METLRPALVLGLGTRGRPWPKTGIEPVGPSVMTGESEGWLSVVGCPAPADVGDSPARADRPFAADAGQPGAALRVARRKCPSIRRGRYAGQRHRGDPPGG